MKEKNKYFLSEIKPYNTHDYSMEELGDVWSLGSNHPASYTTSAGLLPSASTLREFNPRGYKPGF